MAVELGGMTLQLLTRVTVNERARVVPRAVPGLSGDLSQVLGRPSVEVTLEGIFYGSDAADQLKQLRALKLGDEPVDFFADTVGDGYFSQVMISGIEVVQAAGDLDQFTYRCELMEYVEPPAPAVPLSALAELDAGILSEAAGFLDDVQNAVEQVTQLADMLASMPSFGDPTGRLVEMPKTFNAVAGGQALNAVAALRDLLL
jgi:hypothetical protein